MLCGRYRDCNTIGSEAPIAAWSPLSSIGKDFSAALTDIQRWRLRSRWSKKNIFIKQIHLFTKYYIIYFN